MTKTKSKLLQLLTAALICVAVLQLLRTAPVRNFIRTVTTPEFVTAILYLGTGRAPALPDNSSTTTEPPPTEEPPEPVSFQAEDAELLEFYNYAGVTFDPEALLLQPISWELTGDAPTVLIYHTHTTESYENTENYTESSAYRSLDEHYNMISIGERLAQRLEEAGIHVIHDKTVHDYPDYNSAYARSRETIEKNLEKYPTIQLVLDIHRDAYEDGNGNQATSTISIDGTETARLMILTGTNVGGETHPNWSDNLSLATKLQAVLEDKHPGLCRPMYIRLSAFNQFLSPGALLVEVGTAGDTRQNALAAAEQLADAIITLSHGSQ